ncbi:MAG: ABC transporter permease [Clostridia bacterium]|jgi:ABC-2 type transport system permease protein|nr:ABC transporter permease [Clostridia bacterium]
MFSELAPVLWDEWIVFKRGFFKITASAVIAPILYIIAFGFGLGGGFSLKGVTYIKFLIPGVIALTTMNSSYRAISITLNTNRLYDKTFEQYLIAPLSAISFCSGKAIAGALRGLYCGAIVLGISFLFDVRLNITASFVLVMLLSGLTFSCLGMLGALLVKSHADMTRFGTFVMLPMTFLCGTFFSVDQLPIVLKEIIYIFPLTHVSTMLRAIATYEAFSLANILIVVGYFILFFSLSVWRCRKIAA